MLLAITKMVIIAFSVVVTRCFDKDKEIIGLISLAGLILAIMCYQMFIGEG